jgi:hypothetical protein
MEWKSLPYQPFKNHSCFGRWTSKHFNGLINRILTKSVVQQLFLPLRSLNAKTSREASPTACLYQHHDEICPQEPKNHAPPPITSVEKQNIKNKVCELWIQMSRIQVSSTCEWKTKLGNVVVMSLLKEIKKASHKSPLAWGSTWKYLPNQLHFIAHQWLGMSENSLVDKKIP